jgi:hypothetical protein
MNNYLEQHLIIFLSDLIESIHQKNILPNQLNLLKIFFLNSLQLEDINDEDILKYTFLGWWIYELKLNLKE